MKRMDLDTTITLIAGMIIGCLIAVAILLALPESTHNKYLNAIKECEAELPRNIKCIIHAKPEITYDKE